MKKKLPHRQSGIPGNDARDESGYEELRAAVLEGAVFHADKAHGLAIVVTLGVCAWIGQSHAAQSGTNSATTTVMAQPYGQVKSAGCLATLLANLAEQKGRRGRRERETADGRHSKL